MTQHIPLEQIIPNPEQPRRQFEAEALAGLAQSVNRKLIQPIVVEEVQAGLYMLHDGERRWRAAKAVGLSAPDVARLGGVDTNRVYFRYVALRKKGNIGVVIAEEKMAIQYNAQTDQVFADWRQQQGRFPRLVRAVQRFRAGRMNKDDIRLVAGVLARWAGWYAQTAEQRERAEQLAYLGVRTRQGVERVYGEIRAWGIDPFGR